MLEATEEKSLLELDQTFEILEEVVLADSDPDSETTCTNYTF
jgi:hypothetical protein